MVKTMMGDSSNNKLIVSGKDNAIEWISGGNIEVDIVDKTSTRFF